MNKTPEQKSRDNIDKKLERSGWVVVDKNAINWNLGPGLAVREYPTDVGPADYVLFVDQEPVGVVEAKKEEEGHRLSVHETQAEFYARSKLKWFADSQTLPFVYESTGILTRYTDLRDPKPRARPVFSFHHPKTLKERIKQKNSLRQRLQQMPELPVEGLRDCQIRAVTNLEKSFKENRPRALVQMATGSGKTFTSITAVYRLLKFSDAKRVLFLVDKEIVAIFTDEERTPTQRFWDARERIEKERKILESCLDGHSRSRMIGYMYLMYRHGMLRDSDLENFSDDLRNDIKRLNRLST